MKKIKKVGPEVVGFWFYSESDEWDFELASNQKSIDGMDVSGACLGISI